jgi:hypothetical protein
MALLEAGVYVVYIDLIGELDVDVDFILMVHNSNYSTRRRKKPVNEILDPLRDSDSLYRYDSCCQCFSLISHYSFPVTFGVILLSHSEAQGTKYNIALSLTMCSVCLLMYLEPFPALQCTVEVYHNRHKMSNTLVNIALVVRC